MGQTERPGHKQELLLRAARFGPSSLRCLAERVNVSAINKMLAICLPPGFNQVETPLWILNLSTQQHLDFYEAQRTEDQTAAAATSGNFVCCCTTKVADAKDDEGERALLFFT
jgi:hypothetical protein